MQAKTMKSAEAMPESKYDYRPTKELLTHVADISYYLCSNMKREARPAKAKSREHRLPQRLVRLLRWRVPLHEGVDTSTPNGRLVFGIFASIAEFEKELLRSRVCSGLAAARAKGKRLGRPRVFADAQKITELRKEGLSWKKIAKRLGVGEGTGWRMAQRSAKKPFAATFRE
jgi:DNA invertase Pin-like site-specific DNA recombinase